MGSLGEEEQMNQTPNAQLPTPNVEFSAVGTTSNIKHRTSNILWRILDFIVAAVFIYAGLAKIFDLDHLTANLGHLRFGNVFGDLRQLSFTNPVEFASGIDNYKVLPWPVSVALAFYLPWLEIFCGLALVVRFFYRSALLILGVMTLPCPLVTIAAKVRGLDITCGCFCHAS